MSTAQHDRRIVRRAAVRVGALVAGASAVAIAGGVGILVAVLVSGARQEGGGHQGGPGVPGGDRFVVDLDDVLPWVLGLGLAGVIVLGVVAWAAARWSVAPLDDALRRQRTFVSDASHELRTPLTALTSRIQIVQRRLQRGEGADEPVAQLRRDAQVLDDVLTDMLLTAEGAAQTGTASIAESARAAVAGLDALADEAGVRLRVGDLDDAVVAVPPVTVVRMCTALLDNAIGHTPAGAEVVVTARRSEDAVVLRVSDEGRGIADADLPRIFERFARGAESGRRRGFGLGLALVREAAVRVGGRIEVERTSPAGTVFALHLPLAR
ncbi:sensor histidine kinase [Microbacterium hydrothermale]|uniref:sensor histidine kinase n=1 Tax=Microbacterium hydrothermale TaxID=857427 RepID=UPI0010A8DD9F|nr:HAMP domain-containing sensor histidine kinase [Microbacterium hydrothermale]